MSETVEVNRQTLAKFMEWMYFDPAIDTAPEDIVEAESELRIAAGLEESDEETNGVELWKFQGESLALQGEDKDDMTYHFSRDCDRLQHQHL